MDFRLPEIGEGVYEAELVTWRVKPGDTVHRGQPLMEVMTDKATSEVPAPFAGTIHELRAQPGQQIKVGDVILTFESAAAARSTAAVGEREGRPAGQVDGLKAARQTTDAKKEAKRDEGSTPGRPEADAVPLKASPSVRHMARQLGIDLAQVHGSGPAGRILIEDLHAAPGTRALVSKPAPTAELQPGFGTPGQRIKLAGLRRKIAEHLVLAKKTIPHYSYVDECDVSELVRLREGLRETFRQKGVKLTYLAFLVKAAAAALKEVPIVNASLDEEKGEIILHDRYHIGIAVATPAGLIVPVVHDADRKDLVTLAREVERLSTEARAGKARLEDLRGGTFTITSVGGIGGLISTPIVNHPEVAILGVGKVVKRPTYDDAGNIRPADMVYLSFSFDHRVVDGAVGAAFGNAVLSQLQHPAALLLPNC
jgi:pyruvate dehydrogenase E2 component (dihydrolipoamide acetyltransferase)/2-oxoisovalerate dehydrogenase E2 component (dihydrolipoyl transacylase)